METHKEISRKQRSGELWQPRKRDSHSRHERDSLDGKQRKETEFNGEKDVLSALLPTKENLQKIGYAKVAYQKEFNRLSTEINRIFQKSQEIIANFDKNGKSSSEMLLDIQQHIDLLVTEHSTNEIKMLILLGTTAFADKPTKIDSLTVELAKRQDTSDAVKNRLSDIYLLAEYHTELTQVHKQLENLSNNVLKIFTETGNMVSNLSLFDLGFSSLYGEVNVYYGGNKEKQIIKDLDKLYSEFTEIKKYVDEEEPEVYFDELYNAVDKRT
jgi:hypothetical protein